MSRFPAAAGRRHSSRQKAFWRPAASSGATPSVPRTTASRMETHGEPARIHVSAPTRVLLGDRCRFADRGAVVIKGKGAMSTFFPLGRP